MISPPFGGGLQTVPALSGLLEGAELCELARAAHPGGRKVPCLVMLKSVFSAASKAGKVVVIWAETAEVFSQSAYLQTPANPVS